MKVVLNDKGIGKVYVKVFMMDNSGKETFYRDGYSSTIDHYFVPVGALDLVRDVRVDRRAMARLQLVPTARPHDHAPVRMTIHCDLAHHRGQVTEKLDRDAMMVALSKGPGQKEFLEALEANIASTPDSVWQESLCKRHTNQVWGLISGAIRKAASQVFVPAKAPGYDPEVQNRRLELLRSRGNPGPGYTRVPGTRMH